MLFALGCDSTLNPWQLPYTQKLKTAALLQPYLKDANILCSLAAKCDFNMKTLRSVVPPSELVE